ncbi:MAG: homoserine dehydrogenase [Bauldia sp.]|nr:homoserine dehydrogenase [Bauldia sp.]
MSEGLRIGLAGLGTVGASLLQLIARHGGEFAERCGRPVTVTGITARDRGKQRPVDLSAMQWFDDPVALAQDPGNNLFVELIGGAGGVAETAVRAAIEAGKHVVTANKAMLADCGQELAELAEAKGVSLNFEAAVAGGIPIVKVLREAMAGNEVARVFGILNGTCNYILTRMEDEGLDFATCLAEAQRLGYAEADPTFDIEGHDTAHKLAILTAIAFGTRIDAKAIYVEGISSITPADLEAADELGYRIKLLGVASRTETGIEQRVHPAMIPKSSVIANVDGVTNAVALEADFAAQLVLSGPGAGGAATASAVMSDIADIARGSRVGTFGRPASALKPYKRAAMRAHAGGYYLRLTVYDRPGAFAAIATRMAKHGISLESIVQRRRNPHADAPEHLTPAAPQPVILITYETTEDAIRAALAEIIRDGHIAAQPQLIRIEPLG